MVSKKAEIKEKYFITSFLLSGFANVTRKYRVNPLELLERNNIPKEALTDPNIVIDQLDFVNVINDAAKATGQPLFGFELTKYFQFDSFGIRREFFEEAQSMYGVPIIFAFFNLTQKSGARIDLEARNAELLHKISYVFEDEYDCDVYRQISLGLAAVMYCKYSEPLYHPKKISLTQFYDNEQLIEDVCGCKVECGADINALHLPSDFAFQSPVNLGDGELKRKRGFGHVFKDSEYLIELLNKVIAIHLPWGNCNREIVAKSVGMHFKTLQEALKARSTSYAQVLKEFRYQEAKKLLSTTDLSITQVAIQVGYSETAVFTRAFKTWSGESPKAWRKLNSQ